MVSSNMWIPMSLRILFAALLIATSGACRLNRHCDDGDPRTTDVCLRKARFCVNFPKLNFASRQSTNFVLTTLPKVIGETNEEPFSFAEKLKIIRTARLVLEKANPHRFIHLNIYKTDPVSDLNKFERELTNATTNYQFHQRMTEIFQSMNDFHTLYIRPAPLNQTIAITGFSVKEFFAKGRSVSKYVVDDVTDEALSPSSKLDVGSEILQIDGADVNKVVVKLGKESSASNSAAQKAIGASRLTLRALVIMLPPRKTHMTVTFRNSKGGIFTEVFPWIFFKAIENNMAMAIKSSFTAGEPMFNDEKEYEAAFHIKRSARLTHDNMHAIRLKSGNRTTVPVSETFQSTFSAEIITTSVGKIGKLNILRFSPLAVPLLDEFKRLLSLMPTKGLIVDIRGNPGGFYGNSKAFSEVLSGKEMPLRLREVRANEEVVSGLKSVKFVPEVRTLAISLLPAAVRAKQAKEFFSGPALDRSDFVPRQDRGFFGPYITVSDGETYSAGDLFTSLQKDERLSLVVGTASNTGAGGANTIDYRTLSALNLSTFPRLKEGISFTTSFARSFRTGRMFGAILEFFGVKPDVRYYLTKDDILKEDCDLIEFLAKKLDEM